MGEISQLLHKKEQISGELQRRVGELLSERRMGRSKTLTDGEEEPEPSMEGRSKSASRSNRGGGLCNGPGSEETGQRGDPCCRQTADKKGIWAYGGRGNERDRGRAFAGTSQPLLLVRPQRAGWAGAWLPLDH